MDHIRSQLLFKHTNSQQRLMTLAPVTIATTSVGSLSPLATAPLGNNSKTHSGGPERGLYLVQDSKTARMIWSSLGVSGR